MTNRSASRRCASAAARAWPWSWSVSRDGTARHRSAGEEAVYRDREAHLQEPLAAAQAATGQRLDAAESVRERVGVDVKGNGRPVRLQVVLEVDPQRADQVGVARLVLLA